MNIQEAYVAGFCKAAEALGSDPVALYKQAALTRRGAVRWLLQLAHTSNSGGHMQRRITESINRLQGLGRLSPSTAENLSQMRDMADAVDAYSKARGAAQGWNGRLPGWLGETLSRGKKPFPQMIEDAGKLNAGSGLSAQDIDIGKAAKRLLKMVGYIK